MEDFKTTTEEHLEPGDEGEEINGESHIDTGHQEGETIGNSTKDEL